MKKLFAIAAAVILAMPVLAQNQSTNLSIGSLTNVAASTTTNAPSTAGLPVKNHEDAWVRVTFQLSATDAATTSGTFKFARSRFGTNDLDNNAANQFTLAVVNNGTGVAYGSTNVNIGAAPYFHLVSAQNGSTNTMTNVVISVDLKDRRFGFR